MLSWGRVVAAALGLGLATSLAGCSGDGAGVARGDVIPAHEADQFRTPKADATVLVPTGRLKLYVGAPATSIDREDTRELNALTAPEGSVFVPLTWRYETDYFAGLASWFDADATPGITLRTGAEDYELPTPSGQADGLSSYYIAVAGTADEVRDDLELAVAFDGVTQSVDLATGKRSAGRAGALYDIDREPGKKQSCTEGWYDDPLASAAFVCTARATDALPYAAGTWAEPGRAFYGVAVRTELTRYTLLERDGGTGAYAATEVTSEFDTDPDKKREQAPEAVYVSEASEDRCPVPASSVCSYAADVVLSGDDEGVPPIVVRQTYQMALGGTAGDYTGPRRTKVTAGGTLRLG